MKPMIVLLLALLSGCAWNPVMTPYAYRGAEGATDGVATVWGIADQTQMYFTEVDGKGLPSRGGGGYPISLSLLPGSYTVEVYFQNFDHRFVYIDLPVTVEAGHTYRVEHRYSPDGARVGLQLKDLGTGTTCRYERYEQLTGHARLVCEPTAG